MDALEIARRRLQTGQGLAPFVLIQRSADRRVEDFQGLDGARAAFAELVRTGTDNDSCALAYIGYDDLGQRVIVIELRRAGDKETVVFAQRFRREQGELREFGLVGNLSWAGKGDSDP
jgi:hypothetical protein